MSKIGYILLFCLLNFSAKAQLLSEDELDTITVYKNLSLALRNPEAVYGLDLSKQKLTEFPREIFKLTNLNVLVLKKNKIAEIPDSIFVLKNLQKLNVSKNKITTLPDSLYALKKIRDLDLSENHIPVISYKFSTFNKLEKLTLWGLPITKIPQELYDLPELMFLDIRQIYFTPKERAFIVDNLPNTVVRISNVCDCGN